MSDQPHYPYRSGDQAVLGPGVTATANGERITWQGAAYRRDHGEPGDHVYLSTGCFHGDHDYCKAMTGLNGAKRPGSCKHCGAKCICGCHREPDAPAPAATQATERPAHVHGPVNVWDCPGCVTALRDRAEEAEQLADAAEQRADRLAAALRQALDGYWKTGCLNDATRDEYAAVLEEPAAHDAGPSVAECADSDARHWNDKYDRP